MEFRSGSLYIENVGGIYCRFEVNGKCEPCLWLMVNRWKHFIGKWFHLFIQMNNHKKTPGCFKNINIKISEFCFTCTSNKIEQFSSFRFLSYTFYTYLYYSTSCRCRLISIRILKRLKFNIVHELYQFLNPHPLSFWNLIIIPFFITAFWNCCSQRFHKSYSDTFSESRLIFSCENRTKKSCLLTLTPDYSENYRDFREQTNGRELIYDLRLDSLQRGITLGMVEKMQVYERMFANN